jgi:hypothetical protein
MCWSLSGFKGQREALRAYFKDTGSWFALKISRTAPFKIPSQR